jgi:hypothetical protein
MSRFVFHCATSTSDETPALAGALSCGLEVLSAEFSAGTSCFGVFLVASVSTFCFAG